MKKLFNKNDRVIYTGNRSPEGKSMGYRMFSNPSLYFTTGAECLVAEYFEYAGHDRIYIEDAPGHYNPDCFRKA